jgi:hypothetical protein
LGINSPDPDDPYALIHKRDYPYVKKSVILKKYSDYTRFCFVRNPWDRVVSCYTNKIHADKEYNDQWYTNGVATPLLRYGETFKGGMKFEAFVDAINDIPDHQADDHFKSQYLFVTDNTDTLLVNFIGKFENFEFDFNCLYQKIGLPPITLPHMLKSTRKNYKSYYNSNTKRLIGKRYTRDIELFRYDFI